jgi:hypothetical protein
MSLPIISVDIIVNWSRRGGAAVIRSGKMIFSPERIVASPHRQTGLLPTRSFLAGRAQDVLPAGGIGAAENVVRGRPFRLAWRGELVFRSGGIGAAQDVVTRVRFLTWRGQDVLAPSLVRSAECVPAAGGLVVGVPLVVLGVALCGHSGPP